MAKFIMELPNEELKRFAEIGAGAEKMLGEMTEAGAKVVYENVKRNMKAVFKTTENLEKNLVLTQTYKTPSDDGINTKVGIYGYLPDGTPAPLVALAREYGTSQGEAKKPFMRKSFNKGQITKAMLKVQERYIKDE